MTKISKLPKTSTCTFLSIEAHTRGSDPAIPFELSGDAWMAFEPLARRSVKATLRSLPLRELCDLLRSEGIRLVRPPAAVRLELARDQELVRDLVQDVGLAFINSVARGAISSARPAVYVWVTTTAPRITRHRSRSAAIALLSGATLSDGDPDDGAAPRDAPLAGLDGGPMVDPTGSDEQVHRQQKLKQVLFHATERLTDGERRVFAERISGRPYGRIAAELGITPVAARIRMNKARKKLAG